MFRICRGWHPVAAAWLLALLVALLWPARPVAAQHGCDPGNLIPNCDFDVFVGSPPRQVPEGWWPFVLSGEVEFRQVTGDESHSLFIPSSLRMSSNTAYHAGIFTQVSGVQPGVAYLASIGWGAPGNPTSTFGRQLGIDPTGGTDPTAPTVVWGREHWGSGRMLNYPPSDTRHPNIDLSVIAQAPTITVFVKVNHNADTYDSMIFLDAVSLYVDPNQPTPAPPTDTPVPLPTNTPRPRPTAARTATPLPSPTPTATGTATPTSTPTLTFTPTVTPTPTQTYTPSPTATSTLPPRPTATRAPEQGNARPVQAQTRLPAGSAPRGLLWGGLGAFGLAGVVAAALVVARRD